MAFPTFRDMIEPLLRVLADAPDGLPSRRAQDLVADRLQLSAEDRQLRVRSGTQLLFRHRINWGHDRLKRAQLSSTPRRGFWKLTAKGLELVRSRSQPLGASEVHELARAGRDVRIETCTASAQPDIVRKGPQRAEERVDATRDQQELSA